MTAELNSQRVSYYTGVKLIRSHHHLQQQQQHQATAQQQQPPPFFSGGGALPHPPHHPPPHHHHHSHHHPHHFPHPPPQHPPHFPPPPPQNNGNPPHAYFGGGGGGGFSNNTRLYTGSPLIRSTTFHQSVSGGGNHHKTGGGSGGGVSRSFKHSRSHHHHHHSKGTGVGGSNNHHHSQNSSGGSCSGTSSSSSSNEHLNNIQSPSSSPKTLDISPLKLSSSSGRISSSSSSENSSPGPPESDYPGSLPTPSPPSSTLSSTSSADGNKDLDHFYFLDDHWKPGGGGGIDNQPILMDGRGIIGGQNAQWTNSPPSTPGGRTLNMMVDQFFAGEGDNNGGGLLNFGGGGGGVTDLNNNLVGMPNLNEMGGNHSNLHRHHSFSGFNSGGGGVGAIGSELVAFGGGARGPRGNVKFGASPAAASTVVNVETQIGTFNGQRDLEIRLCFIKGANDNHRERNIDGGLSFGQLPRRNYEDEPTTSTADRANQNLVIGDPFKTTTNGISGSAVTNESVELVSSEDIIMTSTSTSEIVEQGC